MEQAIIVQYSLIAAAIISGCASLAAAFSDSRAARAALEGMTRLIESNPIIAIVIAIVLVFANPFLG